MFGRIFSRYGSRWAAVDFLLMRLKVHLVSGE
jgi:hypothetical protein